MIAYKCDRCGKFFEKYNNQGTPVFFNIIRYRDKCLDLCPNCNSTLQEWVTNKSCNCTETVSLDYLNNLPTTVEADKLNI